MHRSGTTIFGEIIKRITGAYMIYEPLNKNIGIKGINYWYQYLDKKNLEHDKIIKNLMEVNLDFKKTTEKTDSFFRNMTGITISHLDYIKFKYLGRRRKKQVVYKDPFMLLNAPLFSSYDECKVLVIVRHPIAIYNSLLRRGWDFDLNELYSQQVLKDNFLDDININITCKHEKVAFLWKQLYKPIVANRNNRGLFIITHEELSTDPFNQIDRISSFLGIPVNKSVNKFIKNNFFNKNINSNNNKVHDYKRDSKNLAWNWQKEYRQEYKIIEEICNDELAYFYPELFK